VAMDTKLAEKNQLKGSKIGRSFKNTNAASDQAKGGRWGATLLFYNTVTGPVMGT